MVSAMLMPLHGLHYHISVRSSILLSLCLILQSLLDGTTLEILCRYILHLYIHMSQYQNNNIRKQIYMYYCNSRNDWCGLDLISTFLLDIHAILYCITQLQKDYFSLLYSRYSTRYPALLVLSIQIQGVITRTKP